MWFALCLGLVIGSFAQDYKSLESDEDQYIERPCRVFDPECIRSYFAAHGHCNKVDGTVPEPLHRSASTGYLPRVNLTVTLVNVDYYGLNGQIVEFYINRKTNKLVLAVQMSNIVSFVRPAYFRFHRRAQEPIVRSTPARVQFAITPTIIIPNLNDLRLDRAEIFSYIESPSPITTVNPLAFASTDLIVERTVAEFFVDRPANQIEEFVNKKTNRLLLAFTFTNFTTSTDNSYFRFNRRGKEPVVTRSSVDVQYISLTATVTIPNLSNLRLDRSEMYLYSEDINPGLRVDLSIFESTEPNVQRSLVEFLLRPDVNLQEAFLIDANFYANTYIQQSICDFGLILS